MSETNYIDKGLLIMSARSFLRAYYGFKRFIANHERMTPSQRAQFADTNPRFPGIENVRAYLAVCEPDVPTTIEYLRRNRAVSYRLLAAPRDMEAHEWRRFVERVKTEVA